MIHEGPMIAHYFAKENKPTLMPAVGEKSGERL